MEQADDIRWVLTTAPDAESGSALARTLVDRRLAACVNLVPGLRSIYRWQGAVEDEIEAALWIKTTADRLDELGAAIRELHPYDTPEVLALPVQAGSKDYLDWVRQSCADELPP